MEPAKVKVTFYSSVAHVEQKIHKIYSHGYGDGTIFVDNNRGCFLRLQESWESLFVGMQNPGFDRHDYVRVTIERLTAEEMKDAQLS